MVSKEFQNLGIVTSKGFAHTPSEKPFPLLQGIAVHLVGSCWIQILKHFDKESNISVLSHVFRFLIRKNKNQNETTSSNFKQYPPTSQPALLHQDQAPAVLERRHNNRTAEDEDGSQVHQPDLSATKN